MATLQLIAVSLRRSPVRFYDKSLPSGRLFSECANGEWSMVNGECPVRGTIHCWTPYASRCTQHAASPKQKAFCFKHKKSHPDKSRWLPHKQITDVIIPNIQTACHFYSTPYNLYYNVACFATVYCSLLFSLIQCQLMHAPILCCAFAYTQIG